jgi:hypothetical protein
MTPARMIAVFISLVSVFGIVSVILYSKRQTKIADSPITESPRGWRWGVAAAGIGQIVLLLLLREGAAWLNSPPGEALPAEHPVNYQLGDQMQLIGFDLSTTEASPGGQLEIVLYWYAPQPPDFRYSSFIHISTGGPPLAQLDKARVADADLTAWTGMGYLLDQYIIPLPENMPSGEYQILVGVYTCETRPPDDCGNGDRLQVTDSEGIIVGDTVPLATLTVR